MKLKVMTEKNEKKLKFNMWSFFQNVNHQNIKYVKGEKNYSYIYYESENYSKCGYNLKIFETKLEKTSSFLRVHKSYLVNIKFIKSIHKVGGYLKLTTGEAIPIDSAFSKLLFSKKLNFLFID